MALYKIKLSKTVLFESEVILNSRGAIKAGKEAVALAQCPENHIQWNNTKIDNSRPEIIQTDKINRKDIKDL